MSHLSEYLKRLNGHASEIAQSVQETVEAVIPEHIRTFTFREHSIGLLLGNVQSGKTGQLLGIIAAAADEGFELFFLLTTDNVYLQEQTFRRALASLDTFNICGEDDEIRFQENKMRKPTLVVLKKNTKVLQKWRNNLSSSRFCEGRALFIVDDEGDAASLNTKINQKEQSAINKHLESMKKLANSSFYLQVTATPQPLVLQTKVSGWKPAFIHYFPPGKGYLGGDFFYSKPPSYVIRLTPDDELDALIADEEYMPEGMRDALFSYLVTGAHLLLSRNSTVCNFLIHPSVRIAHHEAVAKKIGGYLNQMFEAIVENRMTQNLIEAWKDLQRSKPDLLPFDEINEFIRSALDEEKIKIIVINYKGSQDTNYSEGLNIIIGGNSLGRGVTIPCLQTVYYCRRAKVPQADTFWQHCRMFGYDREPGLMRIYIPPFLLKLFTELNNSNHALIAQVDEKGLDEVSLLYPPGIRPTRKNVIDREALALIVGGVNYFPNFPKRKYVKTLDDMLSPFEGKGMYKVKLEFIITLLRRLESEENQDWSNTAFINCIKALKASKCENKAILVVRRDRDIAKGTGTLLSPDDRNLGDDITEHTVLTLYRVIGKIEKGWDGHPLWIPNIKLPAGKNFFKAS
ncbi:MAG: restriction endonuclease [Deltaproteobacteria bacterium]|nr:restriction endonuclease [Deltaproteobacteria bacterium]